MGRGRDAGEGVQLLWGRPQVPFLVSVRRWPSLSKWGSAVGTDEATCRCAV